MIPVAFAALGALVVLDTIVEDSEKSSQSQQPEVIERKGLSKKDIPEEARRKIKKLDK